MDESEAVANRIGIMRQGELVGIGTAQHLKDRYAGGYYIQLKVHREAFLQVSNQIQEAFPGERPKKVDSHGRILIYLRL